jgi:hypothetical protein
MKVTRLNEQVKAWKEVRDIRDYVAAVESAATARNGNADAVDPVTDSAD